MKASDKILALIFVGIITLVGVAVVTTLTRSMPTYQTGDLPGVQVHNYLLALQEDDFERAYSYLSPSLPGYPRSLSVFKRELEEKAFKFTTRKDISFTILETTVDQLDAVVKVRETWFSGGFLFNSGQSSNLFTVQLKLESGAWKITHASAYFASCWSRQTGCN